MTRRRAHRGAPHSRAKLLEQQAYTVAEFCSAYRVSKTLLYSLWGRGEGPRFFRAGTKVLISTAAAREWAEGPQVAG